LRARTSSSVVITAPAGYKGVVGDLHDLVGRAFWAHYYGPFADPDVVPQPGPEHDGVLSYKDPFARL
jgi:hypothetical protein